MLIPAATSLVLRKSSVETANTGSRQHPRTGGAELVTICVEGVYDDAYSTTVVPLQIREHLATELS